jgi:hypothetical protein
MMAKASGITSAARSLPRGDPLPQAPAYGRAARHRPSSESRLELIDLIDDAAIALEQTFVAAAENLRQHFRRRRTWEPSYFRFARFAMTRGARDARESNYNEERLLAAGGGRRNWKGENSIGRRLRSSRIGSANGERPHRCAPVAPRGATARRRLVVSFDANVRANPATADGDGRGGDGAIGAQRRRHHHHRDHMLGSSHRSVAAQILLDRPEY